MYATDYSLFVCPSHPDEDLVTPAKRLFEYLLVEFEPLTKFS